MKPLAIDLFCGLGGWTEGLIAEGYFVIGFDIERHEYGEDKYPGILVLQDVLTINGAMFKDADLIVASPPCQAYSYRAMPWKRAKALPPPDNSLFDACFRIQKEASEAAGRYIPMVVENVKGAQKWVGRARWHYGSYYLWGDVPALMPMTQNLGVKVSGLNWSGSDKPGYKAQAFNGTAEKRMKEGLKQGGDWFSTPGSISRTTSGKSKARKAASARIAKIPFILSSHIARCWKPK
jgi:site-specific DNA-cytosine methylase